MDINLDFYLIILREKRDQAIEANAIFQAQVLDLPAKNVDLQKYIDDLLTAAIAVPAAPVEEVRAE